MKKRAKRSNEKIKSKSINGRRSSGSKCGSNSKYKVQIPASCSLMRHSQKKIHNDVSIKNPKNLQATYSMVQLKFNEDEMPERLPSKERKKGSKTSK